MSIVRLDPISECRLIRVPKRRGRPRRIDVFDLQALRNVMRKRQGGELLGVIRRRSDEERKENLRLLCCHSEELVARVYAPRR